MSTQAKYDPEEDERAAKATAPDYATIKGLQRSKFAAILRTRQSWADQKKEAMAKMVELDSQLGKLLVTADVEAVRCNEHTVVLHVNKTYEKLSEDRLLQNGVTPHQIAASREVLTKRPYLQVYPPRGKKVEGDPE